MVEDKTERLAEIVADAFTALEATMFNAKRQILELYVPVEKPKEDKPVYDVSKILWQPAIGVSGAYERSEDVDNPEFKALLKDLANHQGKFRKEDAFYWVFQNGSTVGRKVAKWKK